MAAAAAAAAASSSFIANQFNNVLQDFMQDVDAEIKQDLVTITSSADLFKSLEKVQENQAKASSGQRAMSKIRPFLLSVEEYAGVIETLVTIYPEVLASIWGPVKFLLQIASNYERAFDDVANITASVGRKLPLFNSYGALFEKSPAVVALLQLFYKDILDFYSVLLKFFKIKGWKVFYEMLWPSYSKKLLVVQANIEQHKALLDDQTTLEEMRNARDRSERALKAYDQDRLDAEKASFHQCREALAPPVYRDRVLNLQQDTSPDTCHWIFRDRTYLSWMRSQMKSTATLWLCGIPGAGKSHLAAAITRKLENSGNLVLSTYLSWQEDKLSWINVLHSFVFQVIHHDGSLRPVLVSEYDQNFQGLQSSELANETLLQKLLSCVGPSFIVVDGLDEVKKEIRVKIMRGLLGLVMQCDGLRVLCSSREELDIAAALKPAALVLRVAEKNSQDIKKFFRRGVSHWLDELQADDDLDDQDRSEIEARTESVPESAAGMFLFARLVPEHLRSLPDMYSIRREIQNLPKGLGQVYDRMLDRCASFGEVHYKQARLIISWLACSAAPLRKEEILQALMIDETTTSVDLARRPLKKDLRFYCGPLVEERGEFATFVHFTARDYILTAPSEQVQAWLDIGQAHAEITQICLTFLTLSELNIVNSDLGISRHLREGRFVLLTYALAHWLEHLSQVCALVKDETVLSKIAFMAWRLVSLRSRADKPPLLLNESTKVKQSQKARQHLRALNSQSFDVLERFRPLLRQTLDTIAAADASGIEPADHPLVLLSMWHNIQSVYHSIVCKQGDHLAQCCCNDLQKYHGYNMFKCNKLDCVFARSGLPSEARKIRHLAMHARRFTCPLPECSWRMAFGSQSQLETHTRLYHTLSEAPVTGKSATLASDIGRHTLHQMLVDSIEISDQGTLSLILDRLPDAPLDYLIVLAYLMRSSVSVLNELFTRGAKVESDEVINHLYGVGALRADQSFNTIEAALYHANRELSMHLHKPRSAMTLAVAASSVEAVDWLIAKGMSVSEQKTSLFNSRPLDHLFALQLARYSTAGARRPLNIDIVRILLDAGAPVNPGQALKDLCQTPFVSRLAPEDETWTRAAELMLEKGAVFAPDAASVISSTSKSKRLLNLATNS